MLRDGLVLDLPLREKDGDAFMSNDVYGHRCTNHGSNWNMEGHTFDGIDDYVDCGDIDYTNFGEITLSLWEKTNIIPVNHNILMANAQPNTANGFAITHYRNGRFYFYHGLKSSYTPSAITAGVWHHLAFVIKEGDTIQGFVDGVGYGIFDVSVGGYTIDNGTVHTNIGKAATGTAFPHNGSIDEVRIYNRALTTTEILTYFNATKVRYGL